MSAPAPFVAPRRVVQPIAPAAAVPVHIAIEPDEQLTTEWLRQLIADARAAGCGESI